MNSGFGENDEFNLVYMYSVSFCTGAFEKTVNIGGAWSTLWHQHSFFCNLILSRHTE